MATKAEVRLASAADAATLARMFNEFNAEFGDEALPEEALSERIRAGIARGDMAFLLAGEGPDGFAQVAFQPSLYRDRPNAYLGELWVRQERRGLGLGRALLEAAMGDARARGCDHMDVTTSMGDDAARGLYESAGFTNREGDPDGPLMIYSEREL